MFGTCLKTSQTLWQNQDCCHFLAQTKTCGLLSPPGSSTSGFSYDNTPSACVWNGRTRSYLPAPARPVCSVPDNILSPSPHVVCPPHKLPPQMSHQMGGVPMMPPQPVMYNQPVLRPTNPFGPIPGTQVQSGKCFITVV